MIGKINVIYWKWDVITGERTRLYSGSGGSDPNILEDFDIQLVQNFTVPSAGMGVIEIGNLTQIVEDNEGRLSSSNLLVRLFNKRITELMPEPIIGSVGITPPTLGSFVTGPVGGLNFGIFEPLLLSSGNTFIVMQVAVFALRRIGGDLGAYSLRPEFDVDSSLQIGEVNTYGDYLIGDYVSTLVGYVEPNTIKQNVFEDTTEFQIVALDKLLSYLKGTNLGLNVLSSTSDILSAIGTYFPFAEIEGGLTPSLGTLWWLNNFESSNDLRTLYGDGGLDLYFSHGTSANINNNTFILYSGGNYVVYPEVEISDWKYINRIGSKYALNLVEETGVTPYDFSTLETTLNHTDPELRALPGQFGGWLGMGTFSVGSFVNEVNSHFQTSLHNCFGISPWLSTLSGNWSFIDWGTNRCPYLINRGYMNRTTEGGLSGSIVIPAARQILISGDYSIFPESDFGDYDVLGITLVNSKGREEILDAGVLILDRDYSSFYPCGFKWEKNADPLIEDNYDPTPIIGTRGTTHYDIGDFDLYRIPHDYPQFKKSVLNVDQKWEPVWYWDYNCDSLTTNGGYSGIGPVIFSSNYFRRIFFINEDRTSISSYPAPEFGEYTDDDSIGFSTLNHAPHTWIDRRSTTGMSVGEVSNIFMTPHLDIGDITDDLIVYTEFYGGTTEEAIYNSYPVYFKDSDGQWKRTTSRRCKVNDAYIGSSDILSNQFGIDGPYWTGTSYEHLTETNRYNPTTLFDDQLWRTVTLSEANVAIADKIPMKPIFTKDGFKRREIWFYDYDDKTLYCLDAQLKLKYAFGFECAWNEVILGNDNAGYLFAQFIGDNFSVWARFEPTNDISLPDARIDNTTAENILTSLCSFSWSAWWCDFESSNVKLNIRQRYTGTNRGKIHTISNSYLSDEFPSGDTTRFPNREFNRYIWDMYYDSVILKGDYDDIRVGLEGSLYEYTYQLPKRLYHEMFAKRIGGLILDVYGVRRNMIELPLEAVRLGMYDYIKTMGAEWCVLEANSDFNVGLRTDLRCVNMQYNRSGIGIRRLDCIPMNLSFQTPSWFYSPPSIFTDGCYCSDCLILYNNFMNQVILFLNRIHPTVFPHITFIPYLDDRTRGEIIMLIIEEIPRNEVLRTTLLQYAECVEVICAGLDPIEEPDPEDEEEG